MVKIQSPTVLIIRNDDSMNVNSIFTKILDGNVEIKQLIFDMYVTKIYASAIYVTNINLVQDFVYLV
jgi:hypothetical protein